MRECVRVCVCTAQRDVEHYGPDVIERQTFNYIPRAWLVSAEAVVVISSLCARRRRLTDIILWRRSRGPPEPPRCRPTIDRVPTGMTRGIASRAKSSVLFSSTDRSVWRFRAVLLKTIRHRSRAGLERSYSFRIKTDFGRKKKPFQSVLIEYGCITYECVLYNKAHRVGK